jgi:hypothetical protein
MGDYSLDSLADFTPMTVYNEQDTGRPMLIVSSLAPLRLWCARISLADLVDWPVCVFSHRQGGVHHVNGLFDM